MTLFFVSYLPVYPRRTPQPADGERPLRVEDGEKEAGRDIVPWDVLSEHGWFDLQGGGGAPGGERHVFLVLFFSFSFFNILPAVLTWTGRTF